MGFENPVLATKTPNKVVWGFLLFKNLMDAIFIKSNILKNIKTSYYTLIYSNFSPR
jgi:hypothetical protein